VSIVSRRTKLSGKGVSWIKFHPRVLKREPLCARRTATRDRNVALTFDWLRLRGVRVRPLLHPHGVYAGPPLFCQDRDRDADEMEWSRLCALHPASTAIESSAMRRSTQRSNETSFIHARFRTRRFAETETSKFPQLIRRANRDELSISLPRNARRFQHSTIPGAHDSSRSSELSIIFREKEREIPTANSELGR